MYIYGARGCCDLSAVESTDRNGISGWERVSARGLTRFIKAKCAGYYFWPTVMRSRG